MLYIVSTPIGHLKDITLRAVETLQAVDLIAAEDTRHTGIFLKHYGIKKPLTSYFDHNEKGKAVHLLGLLREGKNIALVSDAGTPGICDPGYRLIKLVRDQGIPMTVIPGVTAFTTALTLSGLPSDRFAFEGFVPVKPGARQKKFESIKGEERTVIFYESPRRLLRTLKDIETILGNPRVSIARELTKAFEEIQRASASEWAEMISRRPLKGECVLLIGRDA
jgi:16S rRNA (cytidine1402-2'-O)-methyltransferase